jgi:cobalt-zinc-cadmium resistance protein CzcA
VIIVLPFSILFAFIGMKYFNVSANLMSFGGLAIAIGMLVDATIVIVENIDRMLHRSDPSESRIHIVARACREVMRPIFFAILIIITVFLPIFTLQGVEGRTFKPLAYTVVLALLGSLVFAIFLAPVLSYMLMRRPKLKNPNKKGQDNIIFRTLIKIYLPVVSFFVKRRPLAIGLALLLITIGLAIFPNLGSEFIPKMNEGTIVVRLTMAPSISLDESQRVTMLVEKRLMEIPEIAEVVTRIGRGEVGAHSDPINSAEMYIILKPKEKWLTAKTQLDIENLIREKLSRIPGVLVNITQPIKMTVDELVGGVRADLSIKLFGDDLEILRQKASEIASVIQRIPGSADVQTDQVIGTPQLIIKINRDAIARYGINVSDVQEVIQAAVGGVTAGQIFEGIRRFDIFVRFPPEYRNSPTAIGQILIEAPNGALVPLYQLADIREIIGPRQITRENVQRFISIQCNIVGRDIGTFVEEAQKAIEKNVNLPPGYFITWGGQFELQQEANKRLSVVIPITLIIVCILLFFNFNSIKNSLLILLNIPLALVGGVVALWLTGQYLSVPSSIGFIALFGIALENGMVLVAYLNQLVRDGIPIDEASIKGATLRVRPVLMTALTTALGLFPLLFSHGTGSEVQRPLATVVIGGLVTSTMLTLLVLPALYKWFAINIDTEQK